MKVVLRKLGTPSVVTVGEGGRSPNRPLCEPFRFSLRRSSGICDGRFEVSVEGLERTPKVRYVESGLDHGI